MPIARFEMPDGRIGRFEVPEGTTPEQAQAMIAESLAQQPAPEPETPVAPQPEPTAWERAKPYVMPVAEGLGMGLGGIAGAVPGTLVAPVAGTAGGAVVGAGLGYGFVKELERIADQRWGDRRPITLSDLVTGDTHRRPNPDSVLGMVAETTGNVATGGAYELGGQALAALPASVRAKWAQAVRNKSSKMLQDVAGSKTSEIRQALQNAQPGQTAGQAVAGAGVNAPPFQALEAYASKQNSIPFTDLHLSQEAARRQALDAVTPDVRAAEAARNAAAKPFYQQADASVATTPISQAVDRLGEPLFARPALRDAMKRAEVTAANQGVKMYDPNGNLTGIGAHLIKTELDDAAAGIARTTAAKNEMAGIDTAKDEFLVWLKGQIPAYDKARSAFAQHSPPVDQGNLLSGVQNLSVNQLTGGERPAAVMNALTTGVKNLLKRTGVQRYDDWTQVVNIPQARAVNKLMFEFGRDARMAEQAAQGGQELGGIMRNYGQELQLPNPLSAKIAITNKVLSFMQGRLNKNALENLQRAMLSGRSTLEILDKVPVHQRSALLKAMQNASGVAGANVNMLTPDVNRDEYVTQ